MPRPFQGEQANAAYMIPNPLYPQDSREAIEFLSNDTLIGIWPDLSPTLSERLERVVHTFTPRQLRERILGFFRWAYTHRMENQNLLEVLMEGLERIEHEERENSLTREQRSEGLPTELECGGLLRNASPNSLNEDGIAQAYPSPNCNDSTNLCNAPDSLNSSNAVVLEQSVGGHSTQGLSLSFLRVGQSFSGMQSRLEDGFQKSTEVEWRTRATIISVDSSSGHISGIMEMSNVPNVQGTIVTHWEGEVIDFSRGSLLTQNWGASLDTDLIYWRRLMPFKNMDKRDFARCVSDPTVSQKMSKDYVLMRWKENFFESEDMTHSNLLTISGFYYISMRREDGCVEGYYWDPNSSPYEYLTLVPEYQGEGISFPTFSFT
ncbi:uncharacterized protein VTP21DRAFT_9428 [Calcarisporiella thermophila]|uniref:uncharacterized protein n=1 Tax=Calcarisporiella thermophila TaxID=911321 RepID=UPI00374302B4